MWTWEKDNLQQPSGLFAYHWSNGAVVGTGAATDADLNTAWALVLGATAFGQPVYRTEGLAVAKAVLANETVVSNGLLELVAGPWARNAPYPVDPSYFSPEAMAALATASHDRRWTQLAANSQQLVGDLQGGGSAHTLPPDWALPVDVGDHHRLAAACRWRAGRLRARRRTGPGLVRRRLHHLGAGPVGGRLAHHRRAGRLGGVPVLQPHRRRPAAVHQQPGAGGGGGLGRRRWPVQPRVAPCWPRPRRTSGQTYYGDAWVGPRHRAPDHRSVVAVPSRPHLVSGVGRHPTTW